MRKERPDHGGDILECEAKEGNQQSEVKHHHILADTPSLFLPSSSQSPQKSKVLEAVLYAQLELPPLTHATSSILPEFASECRHEERRLAVDMCWMSRRSFYWIPA